MCHAYNEKKKKKNSGRNRISQTGKSQNIGEKESYKYLGILEVDIIKKMEMSDKETITLEEQQKLLKTKLFSISFI